MVPAAELDPYWRLDAQAADATAPATASRRVSELRIRASETRVSRFKRVNERASRRPSAEWESERQGGSAFRSLNRATVFIISIISRCEFSLHHSLTSTTATTTTSTAVCIAT